MKRALLLVLSVMLISCASHKKPDPSQDSAQAESYLRWNKDRITHSPALVAECHQNKVKQTHYWMNIANCYYLGNRLTKADYYYRLSLEKSKHPSLKAMAYNNLAVIAFSLGQWEEGKNLLNQAIKLEPSMKSAKFNLAQYYVEIGYHEKVISLLSDSAFKNHKDHDIYFYMAQAYYHEGEIDLAKSLVEKIPADKRVRADIAALQSQIIKRQNRSISSIKK